MTTDSPVDAEHRPGEVDAEHRPGEMARNPSGRSIHVQRALKLLYGGLVGGAVAALACIVVFTVIDGSLGLFSAALAAAMVIFFYAAGQLVMVAFADAGAMRLMVVSMASYTTRIVLLGLLLLVVNRNRDNWTSIDAMTVFITAVVVVVGWLVVEVFVFNRLRVGVYDTEYPADTDGETSTSADQDHLRPTTGGVRDAG